MRTMKRVAAVALSVVVLMTSGVSAKAAVTDVQPAKSSSEAVLKWQWPEKGNGQAYQTISDLKIVGKYVYLANNATKKVVKLNKDTGKVEAEHNFSDSCKLDYYADIEYGDDKIYVGYANNKVEAFDADTLKPVWISEDTGHSVTSKMTYKNKKLYFGTGSYGDTDTSYYVLDTKDENDKSENETKTVKAIVKSDGGRFYWKKATEVGKYLIVSDTVGNLTSIDTTDNSVVQTKKTEITFSGSMAYDSTYSKIYFVGGVNKLYGIKVNEDGTFGDLEEKFQFCDTGYSSMTPIVYDGKIYVSGNNGESFSSDAKYKGYFGVASIGKDKTELNYVLPITNYAQCEPLLTKTTDGSVQVYFTMNAEPGGIYSVCDSKDAKVNSIFEPTDKNEINYCMRNIYADENGTMYYSNDAGYVFAVGKKAAGTVKPTESTAEEKPATKPSSEATTVVNETKVKPVTKTVKSTRSVKLTWKKKKSAKGYVIYAKAGKGKYKKVTTVGKKTSKTIKVNKDSSYKFKVKPYKLTKKNKKKYFKAYAAKAKFGSKTVKVTFKNVTGYASYKVQMKAGKAAYKTVKTTTKGGTITYTKKKAKVGTTYKFCLKGINKVNGKTVSVTIK